MMLDPFALRARGLARPALSFLLLGLLAAIAAGCGERPEIAQYQAPKVKRTAAPAAEASVPTRLLGALIPHGDEVWFLKLMAGDEPAQALADPFRALAQSFAFDAQGRPAWQLPSGWEELPGDAIRYKTLRTTQDGKPLDISVTMLPFPGGNLDDYLLANVNRWRGQIGLPPLRPDQMATEVEQVPAGEGVTVYLCNYLGLGTGGLAAMGAPAGSSVPSSSPVSAEPPRGSTDLVGVVPEGWRASAGNALSAAAYQVSSDDGSESAEITVTSLAAAGGHVLENVNRWRGQVALPPVSAPELQQQQKSLSIAGSEVPYVVLAGASESILGVIVPRGDRVWFIKLRGPNSLAEREREHFEAFAQGLRLP